MKLLRNLGVGLLLLGWPLGAWGGPIDSLLVALNQTLLRKQVYDNERWQRIGQLTARLARSRPDEAAEFDLDLQLYEEYKAFQYDSAFAYCQRLTRLAERLRSPDKLASARLKLTFILLSSGLFKEALDELGAIDPHRLSRERRLEYQLMQVRAYSDLADFSRDGFFRPRYLARALAYSDTVLSLSPPGSALRLELQEDLANRTHRLAAGIAAYRRLRQQPDISMHHLAIDASILAKLYRQAGQEDKAFELLLVSAIADVKSATKETTSLSAVSDYCYRRGDAKDAYTFVKAARAEAAFYNARQRKVQLSQISATIEEQKLALIDRQRRALALYFGLAVGLGVLVAAFAVLSYAQLRRQRRTSARLAAATHESQARNAELRQRNTELHQLNETLARTNQHLADANAALAEANAIKEEYIGYSFYNTTQYLDKLAAVKKNLVDTLAGSRQLTGLHKLAGSIDVKQARTELFTGFDLVFLQLFPSFIPQFNALFRPADRVQPTEGQLLTTELRIFALIRLGIHDNERIGRMLGYSVNTIYTYKTRVKNRSLVPNEEFEARVLAIRAE